MWKTERCEKTVWGNEICKWTHTLASEIRSYFYRYPTSKDKPDNAGLTFSFHAFDSFRTKAVTVNFLLQVKGPFPLDLIVRDPIIMVTSPRAWPLGKGGTKEQFETYYSSDRYLNVKSMTSDLLCNTLAQNLLDHEAHVEQVF